MPYFAPASVIALDHALHELVILEYHTGDRQSLRGCGFTDLQFQPVHWLCAMH